ncbi:MAG: 3'-5' exonuclease [Cyanobacteria bacterium P01_H01_bin.74]
MQQSLFGLSTPQQSNNPSGLLAEPLVSFPSSVNEAEIKSLLMTNTQNQTPLSEAVFTVIDLETTGLSPKKSSITEITAIQYQQGKEIAKFTTLVKPHHVIPEEVELLTGITNAMVRHSPSLPVVLGELSQFLGETPLIVGHNVSFDVGFLYEKLEQNGLEMMTSRFDIQRSFCTKVLAKKILPSLPSYEGIVVATAIGYHNPNPHRAEADVRMSAAILYALIEKLKLQASDAETSSSSQAVETVGELLALQGNLSAR